MTEDGQLQLGNTSLLLKLSSVIKQRVKRGVKRGSRWVFGPTTLRKCVIAVVLFTLILIIIYSKHTQSPYLSKLIKSNTRPEPNIKCAVINGPRILQNHDHQTDARLKSYPKVLVFIETMYSKLGKDIAELLVHTRIKSV